MSLPLQTVPSVQGRMRNVFINYSTSVIPPLTLIIHCICEIIFLAINQNSGVKSTNRLQPKTRVITLRRRWRDVIKFKWHMVVEVVGMWSSGQIRLLNFEIQVNCKWVKYLFEWDVWNLLWLGHFIALYCTTAFFIYIAVHYVCVLSISRMRERRCLIDLK